MLDLAETLDPLLNERQVRLDNEEEDNEDVAETTLQLVFFDGEEAFKDWTATDSIYGARYASTRFLSTYMYSYSQTLGSEMVHNLHQASREAKTPPRIHH